MGGLLQLASQMMDILIALGIVVSVCIAYSLVDYWLGWTFPKYVGKADLVSLLETRMTQGHRGAMVRLESMGNCHVTVTKMNNRGSESLYELVVQCTNRELEEARKLLSELCLDHRVSGMPSGALISSSFSGEPRDLAEIVMAVADILSPGTQERLRYRRWGLFTTRSPRKDLLTPFR